VVFRLGRFHRILGPGLSLVLWRLDSARRVQLDAVVRDWQSLTPEQLDARLQQMAVTGQLPPIR
jgi:regulator of protease activity HflC (stomatin/prohibitin superfamily)